ncbi:MAG TPA: HNH endonuclease [Acidimicrobiia bacterium]|jgi:putative restriction endonuclease|nr:HNH endonuclease [Acidimicrobiia bacterium]
MDRDTDKRVRMAAIQRLEELRRVHGDVLPWNELKEGFEFERQKFPLIGQQGIMKPRSMDLALSITTSTKNPYDDEVGDDGFIIYHYQGEDPRRYDNVAVRRAGLEGVPLVYFRGIGKGQYLAFWPAFVQHDDPVTLTFRVAIDEPQVLRPDLTPEVVDELHRRYTTQLARRRLHQSLFRERVLTAYASRCAICRLRHRELLDAAHILADLHPSGTPVVPNGLSLCKIHHSAFDANIVGIRPDYVVEVRADVRRERDGPMLLHGIQSVHGEPLHLPRRTLDKPNPAHLEERFEEFRAAG